jgi:hypothetical protein
MNAPRDWPKRKKNTASKFVHPAQRQVRDECTSDWPKRKTEPAKFCDQRGASATMDECTA